MGDRNLIRVETERGKFAGAGVLLALVTSSGIAFFWPSILPGFDPFRLESNLLLGLVAVTMLCLGLVVEQTELTELKRRPLTVFLGVLVQCTLMPVLAWLVVRALGLQGPIAYGVMLCGCVPGAMASNVLTMTARGNVSYSVSLTSIATLLSPITVPVALMVIAGLDTGFDAFKPVKMATTLLLTVVVPVVAGYLLKQRFSAMQGFAKRAASPVATVALLWIIASVVAGNRDRLWQVAGALIVGLLLMNVLGYVGGYLVGRFAGMPESMRRALTLEVGMQNAGLGTALAASLPGSDSLAQIPTAAYTFGCMLTGTMVAAFWSGRKPGGWVAWGLGSLGAG